MDINKFIPAYILWDRSDNNNWQILATGTYKECKFQRIENFRYLSLKQTKIGENILKDSWQDYVSGKTYHTFADGTTIIIPKK